MKASAEAAETIAPRVEIKVVAKSGQISLGKRHAGKLLRLERRMDGTVLLTPVAMVPETQLWTLEEPHRSRIERGLTWAAKTEARETNVDGLVKRRAKGTGQTRGERP